MSEPTAKTFVTPTLLALAEGVEGSEVSVDAVVSSVCTRMGITEDHYGMDPLGRPKVRMWILQAFNKKLKVEGLAQALSKGKWALTPEGRRMALALGEDATMPEDTTVTMAAPTAMTDGGSGIVWGTFQVQTTYSPDPYIQQLAASATNCFGNWLVSSPVCNTCPLAGACLERTLTTLPEKASLVMARLCKPVSVDISDPDIDALINLIGESDGSTPTSSAPSKPTKPEYLEMKVTAEVVCSHCKKAIRLGEMMRWVRRTPTGSDIGGYHVQCFLLHFE